LKNPPIQLTFRQARRLHAQHLDTTEPFGSGPKATPAAVAHLGYLQIDTIYVIERSHHHILYTRIPSYRREDLNQAQTIEDRSRQKLLQRWNWIGRGASRDHRRQVEAALHKFEQFQLCQS
jgi:uncharacterized protein YcaQ